ncbi:putative maltose permease [Cercophora scortea]|uniref:Maltose permease n=1 Tax=Cercophora scortea TaxID=314031 RepID=A0AAE0I2V2_9PEZI|nr:putative maltose permease [Cercophora scortea]
MAAQDHQHDNHRFGLKDHWCCLAAMTLVSLSTFQYGLDFGIISGLQAMVPFLQVFGYFDSNLGPAGGWNISSERQQLISSLMTLGAFLTSATAGFTAMFMGRRASLWTACVLCVVATIIMQTTSSIAALYVARVVIGLANGLLLTYSQLWILECAPAKYRGLGISAFQIWTAIGTLVGALVDNFSNKYNATSNAAYIVPLGIVYIVPGIIAIGLFFLPESPRWLLTRGPAGTEPARAAIRWLRPAGWDVDAELVEMKTAYETELNLETGVAFWDLFANPVDRRRTLFSVGALLCQASCGSMYMLAFGTYFFLIAGVGDPFEDTVILISVAVLSSVLNSFVVMRYGFRRTMLTTGFVLCGICQLIMAAVWHAKPFTVSGGNTVVAMSVMYLFFYGGCIATYGWLAAGEMPSQRLRSHTFGLAVAVSFLFSWVTIFTAPYFINPSELNWGPRYGYIWFGSCFVTAVWLFLCFPETKDRTLEEIDEMFHARVPGRKFKAYQCVGATLGSTTGKHEHESTAESSVVEKRGVVEEKGLEDTTA